MDLKEAEKEFLQGEDAYQREIQDKMDRRLLISNFLENKQQAQASKYGGEMLAA